MTITDAHSGHVEAIAKRLSEYFTKVNLFYGFEKYKTDEALMLKHVKQRIEGQDQEFKYFVLENDNNEQIGFVNILITPNVGEILVVDLLQEYESRENMQLLVDAAVQALKDANVPVIFTEIPHVQDSFLKVFEGHGGRVVTYRSVIQL